MNEHVRAGGAESRFERAAPAHQVRAPRFLRVEVDDRPVLLTRLSDGSAVAFGPLCPHEGLPLDQGSVWGDEIDCPHHHYTYDPRTGDNRYPRRVFPRGKAAGLRRLPIFAVREEDGWVWVGPRVRTGAPAESPGDDEDG